MVAGGDLNPYDGYDVRQEAENPAAMMKYAKMLS
jgi:hypothetical protein